MGFYYFWLGREDQREAREDLLALHREETRELGWVIATVRLRDRVERMGIDLG